MPEARRSSYNLAFKLKIVAEAEVVENNSEIEALAALETFFFCKNIRLPPIL